MKILIISPKNKTVFNFRGDLIRDMVRNGNEVCVVGPNRDFLSEIYELGVKEFFELPAVKDNISIRGDLKYFRGLRRIIRKYRPDCVFSYTAKPVIYGSTAARLCRVPKIFALVSGLGRMYSRGGLKARAVRFIMNCQYRLALSSCTKVFFQNPDDISVMVRNHCCKREAAVLTNGSGVNMERFLRTELPPEPVFLMVGRVIREKGVMDFCAAAKMLKENGVPARCMILGGLDKSVGALSMEDIRPYMADGSIEYLGEADFPEKVYSQSSVFVLPSYYREGLPRTILEAMSMGRSVITTDWPGCREPIEDGVNGFLVPIKDPEALYEKMKRLSLEPGLRESMGQAAYDICRQKYAVEVVNRQIRERMGY